MATQKQNRPSLALLDYAKKYRKALGCNNQEATKELLGAKDIEAAIDTCYLSKLTARIHVIIERLNKVVQEPCKLQDESLQSFLQQRIDVPLSIMLRNNNNILQRLNNQGRRPEEVCFSWLRGFAIVGFFLPAIPELFGCKKENVKEIGEDNLANPELFRRSPTADLCMEIKGKKYYLEVQAGFQGVNDIKEHKIREARRRWEWEKSPTIIMHVDCFNGMTGFVRADRVKDDDVNWITRQQMEGQTVFTMDINSFFWRLLEPPPRIEDVDSNFLAIP